MSHDKKERLRELAAQFTEPIPLALTVLFLVLVSGRRWWRGRRVPVARHRRSVRRRRRGGHRLHQLAEISALKETRNKRLSL